jgi:hypothetical protein
VCQPKQNENGGNIISKAVIGKIEHYHQTRASISKFRKLFGQGFPYIFSNTPTDKLFEINSEILQLTL